MTERQIRSILVPVDDSKGVSDTLDYAALLATSLGASITLCQVDELPGSMVGIVPGATEEDDLAEESRASQRRLNALAAQLAAKGLKRVETLVLPAPAIAPALVELARSRPFDLIVMGTHARTGVPRLLLGSIAEEVLRRASCPVLTVHLPPEP